MICPSCQALHFDGAFQRCEDCRTVEDMEAAMEGGWITPLVRQTMATAMAGYIRDNLSRQSISRRIFGVSPVQKSIEDFAAHPIAKK